MLVGVHLQLRADVTTFFRRLAAQNYGHSNGHFYKGSVRASDIVQYVAALKTAGLHCEHSFGMLQEGVYPIDASQQNLDSMFEHAPGRSTVSDACGYGDLAIIILAENSD